MLQVVGSNPIARSKFRVSQILGSDSRQGSTADPVALFGIRRRGAERQRRPALRRRSFELTLSRREQRRWAT
jgi:hypothetical protein